MNEQSGSGSTTPTMWQRILSFPLVQILLAVLFVAVPYALAGTALKLFVTDKFLQRAGALLLAGIVLAAYSTYVRVMEKRTVTELSGAHAAREIGLGLTLGALLFCITIGILAAIDVYQATGNNGWHSMLSILPACILAGVFEEILIRAILFRILELWMGSWLALALSAAIFGLLHLLNPGATLLNAAAISIEAGVMLAAAYMLTRRLWLCIGIHTAWNFTQGGIFSVAVSGGQSKGLLQSRMIGPDWLSGGAFGAEGSIVALAVCAVAGILLLIAAVRQGHVMAPQWMRRAPEAGT